MDADDGVAHARATTQSCGPAPAPTDYDTFHREYYRRLVIFALYLGARDHEADDVTAETLLQLAARWASVSDPFSWARTALVHNLIKLRNRDRQRLLRQGKYVAATWEPPSRDVADMVLDRQEFESLLGVLTENQRQVVLGLLRGFTQREVALLLGRTPEAVRTSLTSIRRRLNGVADTGRPTCEAPLQRGRL